MLALVATLIIGYLVVQAAGYVIHRSLHSPLLGPLYRGHTDHHLRKYPPHDYLSKKYRDADLANRPLIYYLIPGLALAGLVFWLFPWHLAAIFAAELALFGWVNDWMHVQLHIEGHWLERFRWFHWLRAKHWAHHVDQSKNFGIVDFGADKVLRTNLEEWSRPSYLPVSAVLPPTVVVESPPNLSPDQ